MKRHQGRPENVAYDRKIELRQISRAEAAQLPIGTQVLMYDQYTQNFEVLTVYPKSAIVTPPNKLYDGFCYYEFKTLSNGQAGGEQ